MIDQFWIVWNEEIERCDFPTEKHFSYEEARQEAERLAEIHKGKKFSVMQLKGTVQAKTTQWEYPDDTPF